MRESPIKNKRIGFRSPRHPSKLNSFANLLPLFGCTVSIAVGLLSNRVLASSNCPPENQLVTDACQIGFIANSCDQFLAQYEIAYGAREAGETVLSCPVNYLEEIKNGAMNCALPAAIGASLLVRSVLLKYLLGAVSAVSLIDPILEALKHDKECHQDLPGKAFLILDFNEKVARAGEKLGLVTKVMREPSWKGFPARNCIIYLRASKGCLTNFLARAWRKKNFHNWMWRI